MITEEMPTIRMGSKTAKAGLGWTGHRVPPHDGDDLEEVHQCPVCHVAAQAGSFCLCDREKNTKPQELP